MKKSKLDTPHIKKEVAKRLATGESQINIARGYNLNHSSVSRFANRSDVQELIKQETLNLLDAVPDAVENIKSLVRAMKTIRKDDHKNRELSYKASQKVLESAGIMNTATGSQTVVNIINKQENIIPPIIEELARRHFGGLILDKTAPKIDVEETAKF